MDPPSRLHFERHTLNDGADDDGGDSSHRMHPNHRPCDAVDGGDAAGCDGGGWEYVDYRAL